MRGAVAVDGGDGFEFFLRGFHEFIDGARLAAERHDLGEPAVAVADVVLFVVAVEGEERVGFEVVELAHAVHDVGFGGETAGFKFHRHHRVALVGRHLDEDVVEVERVLDGHEIDAELGQLAETELAVARFIPEVARHVVMQIKRRLRRVEKDRREVIHGVHFHHEPHVNHEADDAGIGLGVDEPRADDRRLGGVVTEDARARRVLAAVAGGGMREGSFRVLPDVAGGEGQAGFLAEPTAEIIEGLGEMKRPFAGIGAGEVGCDLADVAFFVGDEFFDEFFRRPIGERIGDFEVVPISGQQRGLQDLVEAGGEHERVLGVGADGLGEDFFNAIADRLARAKRRQFAAAFAQETGVAGGFPSVLAEEIF